MRLILDIFGNCRISVDKKLFFMQNNKAVRTISTSLPEISIRRIRDIY